MTGRLEGKVAVITGAGSGIGACTARRFVEEGARVVIGDIQDEKGEAVVVELGDVAAFRHCDVTVEDDVAALVDLAVEHFGQLDVMMNNAGIVGARGPIAQIAAEEYHATMNVLLTGTFFGMKHAARVNCIAPGSTATPLVAKAHLDDHQALQAVEERLADLAPIKGRPGMPLDVANAALYLASDESGNTNGLCLTVDGGATTGSTANDPPYSSPLTFMREAGRTGI